MVNRMQAIRTAEQLTATAYQPANGAVYAGGVGAGLQSVAQLLRGKVPVQVANLVVGGLDTHAGEGVNSGGHLFDVFA